MDKQTRRSSIGSVDSYNPKRSNTSILLEWIIEFRISNFEFRNSKYFLLAEMFHSWDWMLTALLHFVSIFIVSGNPLSTFCTVLDVKRRGAFAQYFPFEENGVDSLLERLVVSGCHRCHYCASPWPWSWVMFYHSLGKHLPGCVE